MHMLFHHHKTIIAYGIIDINYSLNCFDSQQMNEHLFISVLFITLGLSCALPGIHLIIIDINSTIFEYLPWLLSMAFIYIAGGVIFAIRIPERLFPGKFDVWVIILFFVINWTNGAGGGGVIDVAF